MESDVFSGLRLFFTGPPPFGSGFRGISVIERSAAATEAAQRVCARDSAGAVTPADLAATVSRICQRLNEGLSRWIGAEGYRALLRRALDEERAAGSPFAPLQCDGTDDVRIAAVVKKHGVAETAAALVSLVASLIELLGRVVGEDMAVQLIEQAGAARPTERSGQTEERAG